jgi:hypothetical protein
MAAPHPTKMKPKTTTSENTVAKTAPAADRTLHIQWPWSMTWMEYVDEMLEFLKTQIDPGHPLHRKKLYVTAVNKDADAWYVEGEKEDFYAIVYFWAEEALRRQERNPGGLGCRITPPR